MSNLTDLGNSDAARIVALCETDPLQQDDRDGADDRLFSDLDQDNRIESNLLALWQAGCLQADWDEDDHATVWWLSEFGQELCDRGLMRPYLVALERDGEYAATRPVTKQPLGEGSQ